MSGRASAPGWLEAELHGEDLGDAGPALVLVRLSDVYAAENASWGTVLRTRCDREFNVRTPYGEVRAAMGAAAGAQ